MTDLEKKKFIYKICQSGMDAGKISLSNAKNNFNIFTSFTNGTASDAFLEDITDPTVFKENASWQAAYAIEVILKSLLIGSDIINLPTNLVQQPDFKTTLDKKLASGTSIITYLNKNGLLEWFDPRAYSANGSVPGLPQNIQDCFDNILQPFSSLGNPHVNIKGHDICGLTFLQPSINRILLNNGLFLSGNEIDLLDKVIGVFEGTICSILKNRSTSSINVGGNVAINEMFRKKEAFPTDRYAWVTGANINAKDVEFLLTLGDTYKTVGDYKIPGKKRLKTFGFGSIDNLLDESLNNPEIFNRIQRLSNYGGFKTLSDVEKYYAAVYLSDEEINAICNVVNSLSPLEQIEFVSLCVYFKTLIKSVFNDNSNSLLLDTAHLDNIHEYMDHVKKFDVASSHTLEEDLNQNEKDILITGVKGTKTKIEDAALREKERQEFIKSVTLNPYLIKERPEYQDDEEIGLIVVSKDGLLLESLSDRLKENKSVVLTALKQNIKAYVFMNDRLITDNEIYYLMVDQLSLIDPLYCRDYCTSSYTRDFQNRGSIIHGDNALFGRQIDNAIISLKECIYSFAFLPRDLLLNREILDYFAHLSDEELLTKFNNDISPTSDENKLFKLQQEIRHFKRYSQKCINNENAQTIKDAFKAIQDSDYRLIEPYTGGAFDDKKQEEPHKPKVHIDFMVPEYPPSEEIPLDVPLKR